MNIDQTILEATSTHPGTRQNAIMRLARWEEYNVLLPLLSCDDFMVQFETANALRFHIANDDVRDAFEVILDDTDNALLYGVIADALFILPHFRRL